MNQTEIVYFCSPQICRNIDEHLFFCMWVRFNRHDNNLWSPDVLFVEKFADSFLHVVLLRLCLWPQMFTGLKWDSVSWTQASVMVTCICVTDSYSMLSCQTKSYYFANSCWLKNLIPLILLNHWWLLEREWWSQENVCFTAAVRFKCERTVLLSRVLRHGSFSICRVFLWTEILLIAGICLSCLVRRWLLVLDRHTVSIGPVISVNTQ